MRFFRGQVMGFMYPIRILFQSRLLQFCYCFYYVTLHYVTLFFLKCLGTWPTISVEGNRFSLTGFQPRWGWEHSCWEPCSPMRPSTSLASHQAISQNHALKFLITLSVLKPAARMDLCLLWNVHSWVSESPTSRSSSPLEDMGYVVLSLHVVVQGNTCPVTLDPSGVQEATCPKGVASPYVLQRSTCLQLNIPSHSSASSISYESVLCQEGPHTVPSVMLLSSPSYSRPHRQLPFAPFQTAWLLLPQRSRSNSSISTDPMASSSFSLSLPLL